MAVKKAVAKKVEEVKEVKKSKYTVIERFRDIDGALYEVGAPYLNTDEKRLNQLLTKENKEGRPFIKEA